MPSALALGWLKLTVAWLPMLKLCQLNDIVAEFCRTVVVAPLWLTLPLPAVTWAPAGAA
jgi:hypothetical protein